jgi:hypothetical protein
MVPSETHVKQSLARVVYCWSKKHFSSQIGHKNTGSQENYFVEA